MGSSSPFDDIYDRVSDGYDRHVKSSLGNVTQRAAEFIQHNTNGYISSDTAESMLPIAAAGAVIGTGILARKPINRFTSYIGGGIKEVVTGFGYLEKIPVFGKIFTWAGKGVEWVSGIAGYGLTAAAGFLAYKAFQPVPLAPAGFHLKQEDCANDKTGYLTKLNNARTRLDATMDEAANEWHEQLKKRGLDDPKGNIPKLFEAYKECKGGIEIVAHAPCQTYDGKLFLRLWPNEKARETKQINQSTRIDLPKTDAMLKAWTALNKLQNNQPDDLEDCKPPLPLTANDMYENAIRRMEVKMNHKLSDRQRREYVLLIDYTLGQSLAHYEAYTHQKEAGVILHSFDYDKGTKTPLSDKPSYTIDPKDPLETGMATEYPKNSLVEAPYRIIDVPAIRISVANSANPKMMEKIAEREGMPLLSATSTPQTPSSAISKTSGIMP